MDALPSVASAHEGRAALTPLADFLAVARSAGVTISTAESIAALQAAALVGYDDRRVLKDALGLVVAKSVSQRQRFDECFDRYFGLDGAPQIPETDETRAATAEDAVTANVRAAVADSPLAQTLLADDRARLVRDLHAAAARADVGAVRLFTQSGYFVRRILAELGIDAFDAALDRLRGNDDAASSRVARFLESRRRAVADLARDLVERRLGARGSGDAERLHDRVLREARLVRIEARDLERMRRLVTALARKLATRYDRVSRARRGRLDVRRTLHANASFDGIPFRLAFKTRKPRKPRIVVLCDVSGSVAALAQFLLLFMSVIAENVADVRSFAFSDSLLEVTAIVAEMPIEAAIATIMRSIGFRSSDYGRSLAEFERDHLDFVDRRTTVVILGDGRTNYGDPRVDVVRALRDRAKRVLWLNPEARVAWGTDDSEMLRYLPYCTFARECSRLRHLEEVVTDLLRPA